VRRGCPEHGGPAADCGCPLVGKPPPTDAYRPTEAHERWISSRDRGCRTPGCRARAGWADLDHVVAHDEGGATDCDNLCCLCRRHHRAKHAGRFRIRRRRTGIDWITPRGATYTVLPEHGQAPHRSFHGIACQAAGLTLPPKLRR
jgi:hypothetical protein